MAFSRPGALILIPMAPFSFWWCIYSPLTLISFIGYGVSSALIFVRIGPFKPDITIVSYTLSTPLTRTISIVVPRPSMTLTSSTVHSNWSGFSVRFSRSVVWPMLQRSVIRSESPSPVMAEVGTRLKVSSGDSFSQYNATLNPCSLNSRMVFSSCF